MKNLSLALNGVLLIFVLILFIMVNNLKKSIGQDTGNSGNGTSVGKNKTLRVAHVNLDTLNASYLLLKDFQKDVESNENRIQEEITAKTKRLQDEYEAYMQKKQSGNITEVEDEKTKKTLNDQNNALEELKQQQEEVMKEAQVKQIDLLKHVQGFVAKYNKTAKFDYVLEYANVGGEMLYANDSLDITKPIIKGLNQEYKDSLQKASSGTKH